MRFRDVSDNRTERSLPYGYDKERFSREIMEPTEEDMAKLKPSEPVFIPKRVDLNLDRDTEKLERVSNVTIPRYNLEENDSKKLNSSFGEYVPERYDEVDDTAKLKPVESDFMVNKEILDLDADTRKLEKVCDERNTFINRNLFYADEDNRKLDSSYRDNAYGYEYDYEKNKGRSRR